ncbi:uncharacterized protein [Watersipora subatra]|uniref:uncharacterized protein n=1 Tax=Watersipora subatra TaxID=2589382 RepID=UPI00355BC768
MTPFPQWVKCSTFDDENACEEVSTNGSLCRDHQDVCIKIVTIFEVPHDGPKNTPAEKETSKCEEEQPWQRSVKEYVSKICGERNYFDHFTKVDKQCTAETMGGGGTQTRCMCAGNLCNAASPLFMSFRHLTSAIALLMLSNYILL